MKQFILGSAMVLASACGSNDGVGTPYAPGDVTLIGDGLGVQTMHLTACGSECDLVRERCGPDAAADVVLNADGHAVDVLCFEQDVDVEYVNIDSVASATAGNKTVLVLDGAPDGLDVEGDVTISGNNAVVYGEGPDVSVIGGTLKIKKNNATVRGVRIGGDVTITKNNTRMSFCVIEGDLTITGNNTTLAECEVHGTVTILGVNTVLVRNSWAQAKVIAGKNLTCHDNTGLRASSDASSGDVAEVECVDAEGPPAPQSDPTWDAGG